MKSEPVVNPYSAPATPVATVAPVVASPAPAIVNPPKRMLSIKSKDGVVIEDLAKWKEIESAKLEEAQSKPAETESAIPSIPSLPVSIPKQEQKPAEDPTASISGFPVDLPSSKPVEKTDANEFSTPVKEAPEGDDKIPSMINSTPDLSASGRRLVPGGKKSLAPGAKATIKRYTRPEILNLT